MQRFYHFTRVTIFWLFLLSLSIGLLSADIIQIGTGTLYNQALPMEPFAYYSYSQSIYTAAEITTAGVISQIGWQYRINSSIFPDYTNQISIYLGTTNRAGFTSVTDWVPADSLTLVFSGSLSSAWFTSTLPGQGWLNIPLQNVYSFNGSGNLVIAVDENMPGNSSMGDDFACHAAFAPKSLEYHNNSVNPDPANPPAANTGNPLSVRPNVKLNIAPVQFAPYAPNPADLTIDVPLSASLEWQSTADNWDVWFARSNQPLVQVATATAQTTWTPPEQMDLYTNYQWRVTAHAGGNVYEGNVWHFTTAGEILTPPQNLTAVCIGQTIRLNWSAPAQGSVMSYRLFRNGIQIDEVQTLQFIDTEVVPNVTYSYNVRAVNHLNQISPPSNTAIASVTGDEVILYQGFETIPDFGITIPDWMNLDIDLSPTEQWENTSFPHEGNALGWITFNPSQTVPPLNDVLPYAGNKMLLSMAALNPPNNDWLISPPIQVQPGYLLSFRARSYNADFGLERLRLLVSTTDSLLASFQPLSEEPWISVPAAWTAYEWSLSSYAGQRIYLAWQCLSWDAMALCLDEIFVIRTLVNQDETTPVIPDFCLYPNPAKDCFYIVPASKSPFNISIYNAKGQLLLQKKGIDDYEWRNDTTSPLRAGIYLIHLKQGNRSVSKKVVIY